MSSDFWLSLGYFAVACYFFKEWFGDLQKQKGGHPADKALPGAFPCGGLAIIIGIVGGIAIVGLETAGEYQLGIVNEQKTLEAYFLLSMTAAAFVEELIFRGFLADLLVKKARTRGLIIGGVILFSLLFALAHDHLWSWEESFALHFTDKAFFSTGILFLNSLFFYALRFLPQNTQGSLIPCMVAHLASNWAVFGVKWAQGFIAWTW